MSSLKIDKEFERYLGDASKFADNELERQLLAEGGPREPVYVWKGHNIIIDGQRRYRLCVKHKLKYRIVEVELADRDAVRDWMDRHQFCRRNVAHSDECRHVARLVAARQAEREPLSKAVEAVAEDVGKTARQVYRDLASSEQYDADMANLLPDVKDAVDASGEKLKLTTLHSLATLTPEQQRDVVAQVQSGEFGSFKTALLGEKQPRKKKKQTPDESEKPNGATDARNQIGIWRDTVGRWLSGIDGFRELFPGPDGDRVIDAAKELYEALGAWKKGIK